jgi:hypothetical protein
MNVIYKCPKCGGDEYFMSKRNIQKGMGPFHRGGFAVLPVCKQCDELMMNLHGSGNLVNRIGRYGLIVIGALVGLLALGSIIGYFI